MNDRDKEREKDAFWDLSALLPSYKAPCASDKRTDTDAVEIREGSQRDKIAFADSVFAEHFVPPHTASELKRPAPLRAYHPTNALLREVRIYPWRTEYDYYEQFRRHALQFMSVKGRECAPVDFFSYMPQYTQLSDAQLSYYLWWRECFRAGRCLPAAYSYLLLYLYELINLGDAIPPAEGQACMLRLWLSYRAEHTRLDALVREWLVDYSLLYGLPAPTLPRSMYRELLSGCRLKEFFVPLEDGTDALTVAVLQFCNNYDYTKSKFFKKESAGDYHRVLRGAVRVALEYLRKEGKGFFMGENGISTVSRDAFTGAICSYRLRRRIEVDYTSFSHTHELRYIISDVLKYAENALRAHRGIKSRLTVYAVDVGLRACLDAYLAEALPPRAAKRAVREEVPDYERRYELPHVAPSTERAAQIENDSWQTTKRLVEAFTREDELPVEDVSPSKQTPPATISPAPCAGLAKALGDLASFLKLCDEGDAAGQRAFALAKNTMTDAVVDKINTVAGDILGDILLEECENGGFAIIEDYRELLVEEGVL